MSENLIQAACLVSIILLGYLLRRFGFFKAEDFTLLSRIVLKITLPAAIISNFSGKELEPSMLAVAAVGLGANLIYVTVGYLANKRQGRTAQAFGLQNLAGYNIGNFIMPFTQSFLGSTGVITASLFDVGNSVFSLGGAYSLASLINNNSGFSLKRIGKTLVKAVAFDTYVIMTVLSLLNIRLPGPVVSLADMVGGANIFLGMLMLGVGIKLPKSAAQIKQIIKILVLRYGIAAGFAVAVWFLLPFALPVRQAIVLTLFAPIASAAPAFTAEWGGDVGLASSINSASVICSVVIVMALTALVL